MYPNSRKTDFGELPGLAGAKNAVLLFLPELFFAPRASESKRLFENDHFGIYASPEGRLFVRGKEGTEPDSIVRLVRHLVDQDVSRLLICVPGRPSRKTEDFDSCVVTDHINLSGENPLVGHNDEQYGTRFPDMSQAYDPTLSERIVKTAVRAELRPDRGNVLMESRGDTVTDIERRAWSAVAAISDEINWGAAVYAAVHAGLCCAAMVLYDSLFPEKFHSFLRQLNLSG